MKERFCIVGMGLIGGSLAMALRQRFPDAEIWGVDNHPENASYALSSGMVNRMVETEELFPEPFILFLALPVDVIRDLLPGLLDRIHGTEAVVVDLGSTKSAICEAVAGHKARPRFVAAHPIAGTEHSGPQYALPDLFRNKRIILCEEERSSPEVWKRVKAVFEELGMQVTVLDPIIHDRSYAYVSHLSHAIAYALGLSVLEMEKEIEGLRELSGTGFSSTVRLAKSSAKMWVPVLSQNAEETGKAIDAFIAKLEELKVLMQAGDEKGLRAYIEKANKISKLTGN
ncbi:MAG: prephenate dehydrogenase/arogenate dehydrogenase family protein [Bacteroidia bacterium]|nr:prephenate dehydrogenase/arogenate dehydrogenase family protein [Bacteroidia bacterium]